MAGNSIDFKHIFSDPNSIATDIAQTWKRWYDDRGPWTRGIAEVDNYLNATSTETTENDKNNFANSTHRPKLTSIFDTLISNYLSGLLPAKNWLRYEGNDKAAVNRKTRSLIEGYLKTKHKLSGFNKVIRTLLNDWVRTGNCFSQVTYVSEWNTDPETGQKVPGYVGPKVLRISPHDIVFNPLATDFENSPKIVRTTKSLGELARDMEENPELKYVESVFDLLAQDRLSLTGSGVKTEDVDKYMQMTIDGFGSYTEYLQSGMVELLDFYGDYYDMHNRTFYKNQVITVVDRRYVIRNQPLNTWNGRPHIFHSGWRERTNNLWHMGPLENIVGLQYRIDHLENAKADAFDAMLSPDLVFVGEVDVREGENGAKIYEIVDGNGAVKILAPDTTVLNADLQIDRLEASMEEYAGAPPEAAGFRSPGEKTKFEVAQLATASGKIFQNKMKLFEEDQLEKIANAELEVGRDNFNTHDTIELIDPVTGAKLFEDISKQDITANGKLVPIGSRHFIRQAQLAQELLQFQQSALVDEKVAAHFPAKKVAKMWEEILGFDEFDLFEEFGRIPEDLEAARLTAAAQKTLQEENDTPTDGEDFEDDGEPDEDEELIG